MSKKAILGILAVILGVVIVYATGGVKTELYHPSNPLVKQRVAVQRIRVISGHEFDVTLRDGRRIHGRLPVDTPLEATKEVVKLINSSTDPEVVLLNRENELWLIEIHLTVNGKKIRLVDWLSQNNLIWNR